MKEYGITTNHAILAKDEVQAVSAAEEIGYPVVMKIDSKQITHKTDAGGVILSIYSAEEAKKAYTRILENAKAYKADAVINGVAVMPMITDRGFELLLGSKRDEVFGQVLVFGAGGTLVEVLKDSNIGLPPLTQTLATRMMEETKSYKLLKEGSRDRLPANLKEIEKAIINFSHLITDFPQIVEVDINPLLTTPKGVIALDARIILDGGTPKKGIEHLCIVPYPADLTETFKSNDGKDVLMRPIRPYDEPLVKSYMKDFLRKLNISDSSMRLKTSLMNSLLDTVT